VLEGRDAGGGEALTHRLDVVRRGRHEREGLLGVEPLLENHLGRHLTQRREVGERLLQAALDPGARVEMVIGDQRAEVVSGERDQYGIDELARSPGAVGGLPGVRRGCLPRPSIGDPRRVGRQKVAELPGHAAEV